MSSPLLIPIREAEEPRDLVHRCVQALVEGQIVVLPTETIYGVAASLTVPQAALRLAELKGRQLGHAFTIAVKSPETIWDFVPNMTAVGWRLARRGLPGPLTLVLDAEHPLSALRKVPAEVRQLICPKGTLGFRVPDHFFIREVLRLMPAPLVLTSVNRTGEPPAVTAQEAAVKLPGVDIIFDDGPARLGAASTVVQVTRKGWSILREGALNRAKIAEMAAAVILFVCAGNTCRSPMAQALCQALLAGSLGCSIDQLRDYGVVVQSAGLEAFHGDGASPQTLQVLREYGIELKDHCAQPLSEAVLQDADRIYTMTASLRDAILARWPGVADRIECLHPSGQDILDPFGSSLEAYRECARIIDQALQQRRGEILGLVAAESPKE